MGDVKNFRFKTSQGDVNIPVKDIVARERIGDLDELHTQHKDNLVNAINDLEGGSGGTSDYTELNNKPSINGVTLVGNKTTEDLGIEGVTDYDELDNKPSINGKELEGNLSTEDLEIEYDDILNRPIESGDLDIDAVVDPLPTVVSKSNVVFDERGTEYEDGIYIKEINGTVMYKPVYRKDSVVINITSAGTDVAIVTNVETLISNDISALLSNGNYHTDFPILPNLNYYLRCELYLDSSANVHFYTSSTVNWYVTDANVSTFYTKTTDTWQVYEEDTQ